MGEGKVLAILGCGSTIPTLTGSPETSKCPAAPEDAALAVEMRSMKKGKNGKSRPVVLRTALKERFLTLTKMMRMMKMWMRKSKMATEYSPPVYIDPWRKSERPPPSLNAWWRPSNGTETLPIPKRTPPF